jgi:SAM-dependent methyltransferase
MSQKQLADDQAALWNSTSCAWVDLQELLDQELLPFENLLVEVVAARAARRVLDVGCGTGSTTLAVARSLGAEGRCVGVDISQPMTAVARARAERERVPADFICADAQTHAFQAPRFDMIISRFGVMFFPDLVQAFTNLRHAARPDGALQVIVWRSPAENPFMTTAERAAAPFLPQLPPGRPDAPGQFALADRTRVQSILERGGWADIDMRPIDVGCSFPEKDLVRYFTRLGPVARVLHDTDEATRKRVVETVRPAFDPYVHGDQVRFDAACWMIRARSPGPRSAADPSNARS